MPKPILIDCDPGHDDAIAILLALGNPEVDLVGVTTVAGNGTLQNTTLNARRVIALTGITDLPLAAGAPRPLIREARTAADIHGESGLDGTEWGHDLAPLSSEHAVDLIIELASAHRGDLTLVPTGPLTNIAMALRREPRLAEWVREVIFMGGSYSRGNTTPAAEFNMLVDPEAAAIVVEAPWQVTMVGLDLTHQALATEEVLDRIAALGTPLSSTVVDILRFFAGTYRKRFLMAAPPVHDPCTVARIIAPEVVCCVEAFVAVETTGTWTSGMTIVDFDGLLDRPRRALVATDLDADGFWDLVVDALARLSPS
jgi:inosine-uridine nucleoside N-ribohydrolase